MWRPACASPVGASIIRSLRRRPWDRCGSTPGLAAWLAESFGVPAAGVRDLGLRDAEDPAIFEHARTAQAIVLTKDRDFVDLVTRHGPPPQIVWLTCGNTSNTHLRTILTAAWPRAATLLAAGEPMAKIGGMPF